MSVLGAQTESQGTLGRTLRHGYLCWSLGKAQATCFFLSLALNTKSASCVTIGVVLVSALAKIPLALTIHWYYFDFIQPLVSYDISPEQDRSIGARYGNIPGTIYLLKIRSHLPLARMRICPRRRLSKTTQYSSVS